VVDGSGVAGVLSMGDIVRCWPAGPGPKREQNAQASRSPLKRKERGDTPARDYREQPAGMPRTATPRGAKLVEISAS
jgi:hypothetical protein